MLKLMSKFFLFAVLASCNKAKKENASTQNYIADLLDQRGFYLMEMAKVQGVEGFIETNGCDAVMFSGLAMASGLDVNLFAAEGQPGQWFRTPDHECYDNAGSGSDISRDMLIGIMFALWSRTDSVNFQNLYDWGESHDWYMGRGAIDVTYFTPNLRNTLKALLGKKMDAEFWVDPQTDHQRHVVALNIILRGEATGSVPKEALGIVQHFATKEPKNALFQYALARFGDGNQQKTLDILRNKVWFPMETLPTSNDRCMRWMWERTLSDSNISPCEPFVTHSGADFTFLVWLLEQSTH